MVKSNDEDEIKLHVFYQYGLDDLVVVWKMQSYRKCCLQ